MDADKPAQRKSYAGNTTLEIFEVLWRHSYFGHGLTVRQILDELARKHQLEDPSELPTEKTIRNQLKSLPPRNFSADISGISPKVILPASNARIHNPAGILMHSCPLPKCDCY